MKFARLRRLATLVRNTPLHPQWLLVRDGKKKYSIVSEYAKGVVLDIGCSDRWPEPFVKGGIYIGLDSYTTGRTLYRSRPSVYGVGEALPFAGGSVDVVLLMDVLEHIGKPSDCITEVYRVLRPGGAIILQVPFMYPLHDEPHDFQRWTKHGLFRLFDDKRFSCKCISTVGNAIMTTAVLSNIAVCNTALQGIRNRDLGMLLLPFAPPIVLVSNLIGMASLHLFGTDEVMPIAYRAVFRKNNE